MPPVEGWKITCARKEWLRGWWWVGGADGRAEGQRTLSSLTGSFSQLKLQLRQLVQLTCQAKRDR